MWPGTSVGRRRKGSIARPLLAGLGSDSNGVPRLGGNKGKKEMTVTLQLGCRFGGRRLCSRTHTRVHTLLYVTDFFG